MRSDAGFLGYRERKGGIKEIGQVVFRGIEALDCNEQQSYEHTTKYE